MSTAVKSGDTVAVHYTGTLEDGSVFDSSREREPLEFVLGEQNVIPGFEKMVLGMTTGETKTTTIPAADAYGEHRPEMIVQFERDKIPPDMDVQIGQELQVQTTSGQALPARVVDTSDAGVTLDANHPLAGRDLTFDIELVEIVTE
jgi:FKBP-type peptidyl-prolyl cis-trans isomerase 2